MEVFFDTNVYVAEALLGRGAERMIAATILARWRVYCTAHVLDDIERVISRRGFTRGFATLTRQRARRRSTVVRVRPSKRTRRTTRSFARRCLPAPITSSRTTDTCSISIRTKPFASSR
jgi:predicted nucleic acid-binding protein